MTWAVNRASCGWAPLLLAEAVPHLRPSETGAVVSIFRQERARLPWGVLLPWNLAPAIGA